MNKNRPQSPLDAGSSPEAKNARTEPGNKTGTPVKAECEIVQDLLPLYAENLASKSSEKLVESHLENCRDCQEKLKILREGESPAFKPEDVPMEDAFKKVSQRFHRHHRLFALLGVLVAILVISFGLFLARTLPLPSRDAEVSVPVQDESSISLVIESHYGKLFWTSVKDQGDGNYAISGSSWHNYSLQPYSNTFTLQKPVNEVSFNGEVIYQDGVVITPRCRQEFQYANGYAGDTRQMNFGMPSIGGYTFHIEADTDTPERCIWDYVLNPGQSGELKLSEEEDYALHSQALLKMALTPNLAEIRYSYPDGKTILSISRLQLIEKLEEHGVSEKIDTLADLQRIMNIILPPAG